MARKRKRKLTPAQQSRLSAAFSEVKEDEPAIVAKTRRKGGSEAAQKQKVAIAFSKAGLSRKKRKRGSSHNSGHGFKPGKTMF